ncbi:hypothetical protein LCGC14_0221230 [marine sediment metagenome]|uniref:Uncharacterized protein n=1 Tax=marine sediment metagenome TaxID=412755 RepID=A0A0F9UDI6_9ZZZZ
MECLVCRQKIKLHEQIFWGNQMECCGPGDSDCSYSGDSGGLMGAIHLSCLESPTAATRTPNTTVSEPLEKKSKSESVVERSDALALFN